MYGRGKKIFRLQIVKIVNRKKLLIKAISRGKAEYCTTNAVEILKSYRGLLMNALDIVFNVFLLLSVKWKELTCQLAHHRDINFLRCIAVE